MEGMEAIYVTRQGAGAVFAVGEEEMGLPFAAAAISRNDQLRVCVCVCVRVRVCALSTETRST